MELKKIYLFASVTSPYGVIDDFTVEFNNALNRQGIISRIIEAKRDDPHSFLHGILDDPPDCTLSFDGLLPDAEGHFLSDLIKIPHVAYLTYSPQRFFSLVKSPLNVITCVDRNFCQTFRDLNFSQVLFLPHAVSKSVTPLIQSEQLYDVLMLNSFIDYEALHQAWPTKYSPAVAKVMEEAAEQTLVDIAVPYMQAFTQTLDKYLRAGEVINARQLNYEAILDDLEAYIKGRSRIELLKSIKDVNVHVFGRQQETVGWKKYLGEQSNIKIHPPVTFLESLELMKRAKILINCTPNIKQGMHEGMLNGMACGAAVLSLHSPFMDENFQDEGDVLLYHPQRGEEMNQKIHTYLNDDAKRFALAGKGREKVMQLHTWDQRAQTLMKELPPVLEGMKQLIV